MKILFITFNQINQGTYFRAFGFAKSLCRKGHLVTIVSTSRKNRIFKQIIEDNEYPNLLQVVMPDLFSGKLRSGWDPWNVLNRIFWLYGKEFDIIHAFESRPTVIYPSLFYNSKKFSLIMDWADWFGKGGSVEERSNPIIRKFLRPIETYYEENFRMKADSSTVICSKLYEKLLNLGIGEKSILLLPNGVEKRNDLPINKEKARFNLGLDDSIRIVGWLGATFYQDAKLMADAFNLLVKQIPNTYLLLAGNFNHNLSNLVDEPEKLIVTGYLNEDVLDLYLSSVDIFWLPIRNTAANQGRFPHKITQYMLYEKPIITSPVGDIPLLFNKGNIGEMVEETPDAYAKATIQLFTKPNVSKIMGKTAKQIVEQDYLWDNLVISLEKHYQSTIANRE